MFNPTIVDELIAEYTAHALRDMLQYWELTEEERAHVIAALYYTERA